MGNLVNQYVAANQPKIDNLQGDINNLTGQIKATRDYISAQEANLVAKTQRANVILSQTADIVARFHNSLGVPVPAPSLQVYAQWMLLGTNPTMLKANGETVTEYRALNNEIPAIQNDINAKRSVLAQYEQQLSTKQSDLAKATQEFATGLAEIQKQEIAAEAQASQNKVNEIQADNPEIQKIKAEAETKQKEAEQATKAKTSTNNTIVIVVVLGIVIAIVAVAWIFKK